MVASTLAGEVITLNFLIGAALVLAPVPAPKANHAEVNPFTQEEVQAILQAADRLRDRTLLLFLLDTGIRSSELCGLKITDVDLNTGKVFVKGKGKKERYCYLGAMARRSLWKYLAERDSGEPLFTTRGDRPFTVFWLRGLVVKIAKRAGIAKAHPHRFRHTFAVQFLRNGGDIFALQILLGHSSLEMVRHYARLAAADAEVAHRRASPADNWLR